jgi:hypothetical protein
MKFSIVILLFLLLGSCVPSRIVNISSKNNYYNRHRTHTFTRPMWIPGHGIVLYTESVPRYRFHKPRYTQPQPRVRRGKK